MRGRLTEVEFEALRVRVQKIHTEAAQKGFSVHFMDANGVLVEKHPDGTITPVRNMSTVHTE